MEIKINSRSGINSAIAQFKKETKKNGIVIEARNRMYHENNRRRTKRKTEERIRRRMQSKAQY
jgi:ribosomal protein S21